MLYCWGKKTKTSLFLPLSKLCDKGLSPRNLHGGENWVQRWLYQLCWDTNITYRFFSAWSLGAVSLHLLSKTIQEFFHLLSFSSFDQEASIFLTKKSCCRMQGKVYLYVLDTSNLHIFNRKRKNWVKNVAFAKIVYSGRRCSDTFFFNTINLKFGSQEEWNFCHNFIWILAKMFQFPISLPNRSSTSLEWDEKIAPFLVHRIFHLIFKVQAYFSCLSM